MVHKNYNPTIQVNNSNLKIKRPNSFVPSILKKKFFKFFIFFIFNS